MQGFNMGRYVPPEALDANLSANQASGKGHALGARARKSHLGILTVRFEMPFAIWCSTCAASSNNRLIGQGVRFNAEKKKVGMYFSTPVWSFRMKHVACGGWIELRTDPKSSDFVVAEGAKRREGGAEEGVGVLLKEEEEREKRRADAFAALEVTVDDRRTAKTTAIRIEELQSLKKRDWSDTYAASQKLRREFRAGRKLRVQEAARTEALQERMGLGFDLVPENEMDGKMAALIEFEPDSANGNLDGVAQATSKPLFSSSNTIIESSSKRSAASKGQTLQHQLSQNTRAAMDPFLVSSNTAPSIKTRTMLGLKGKKTTSNPNSVPADDSPSVTTPFRTPGALVAYDSD